MDEQVRHVPSMGAESFEILLAGVATRLLGAPLESFDARINDALARLVMFCGAERSTLSLVDSADGMVHTTYKADVRLIAASNRDLAAAAREGAFRPDLYYRLRVFPIELPPLRARKDDIPVLVWHFLNQLGMTLGRKIERVPAPTMDRLIAYHWPGNIRELRNVLERAVILSPGSTLFLEELGESVPRAGAATTEGDSVRPLEDMEREHILRALESCDRRVRGKVNAASRPGLNASTLFSRMKKLGIRRSTAGPRRRARG